MLEPHRLMNLNYCLANVTAIVLKCLLERGDYPLDGLLRYCRAEDQEINEQDITLAVSFLYLLGRVEYTNDKDLVGLVGFIND